MSNEAFVNQHVTLALDGQLACLEFGRAAATVFPPSGPSLESPVYEIALRGSFEKRFCGAVNSRRGYVDLARQLHAYRRAVLRENGLLPPKPDIDCTTAGELVLADGAQASSQAGQNGGAAGDRLGSSSSGQDHPEHQQQGTGAVGHGERAAAASSITGQHELDDILRSFNEPGLRAVEMVPIAKYKRDEALRQSGVIDLERAVAALSSSFDWDADDQREWVQLGQLGQVLHDYFEWVHVREAPRDELWQQQYQLPPAYGAEEWGVRPDLLQDLATAAMVRLLGSEGTPAAAELGAAGAGGMRDARADDAGQGGSVLQGITQGHTHNSRRVVLGKLEEEVLRLVAMLQGEELRAMDALKTAEMLPERPGRRQRVKVLESRMVAWARIRQVVGRLCYRLMWGLEELKHIAAEMLAAEEAAGKGHEGEGGGAAAAEAAAASTGPAPVRYTLVRRMLRVVVERRRRRERERQDQQPQQEKEGPVGERAGPAAAADSGAAAGVGYRGCGLSPDLQPLAEGLMLELLESGVVQGDGSRDSLVQEQVAAAAPTAGADPWVKFRLGTMTRADASALQREAAWLGQERTAVQEQQGRKQKQEQAEGKDKGEKAGKQGVKGAGKGRAGAAAGLEQRAKENGAEAVASAAGEDAGQGSAAGAGLEGLSFTAADFRMALRAAESVLVACRTCAYYGLEVLKRHVAEEKEQGTVPRELVAHCSTLQRLYDDTGAGLDSPLPSPFVEPAAHKLSVVQMYGSLCISALARRSPPRRLAQDELEQLSLCAVKAIQAIQETVSRAPPLQPQGQDSEGSEAQQQQRDAGGRKVAVFLGLCLMKEPDAAKGCADVVDKLQHTKVLQKSQVRLHEAQLSRCGPLLRGPCQALSGAVVAPKPPQGIKQKRLRLVVCRANALEELEAGEEEDAVRSSKKEREEGAAAGGAGASGAGAGNGAEEEGEKGEFGLYVAAGGYDSDAWGLQSESEDEEPERYQAGDFGDYMDLLKREAEAKQRLKERRELMLRRRLQREERKKLLPLLLLEPVCEAGAGALAAGTGAAGAGAAAGEGAVAALAAGQLLAAAVAGGDAALVSVGVLLLLLQQREALVGSRAALSSDNTNVLLCCRRPAATAAALQLLCCASLITHKDDRVVGPIVEVGVLPRKQATAAARQARAESPADSAAAAAAASAPGTGDSAAAASAAAPTVTVVAVSSSKGVTKGARGAEAVVPAGGTSRAFRGTAQDPPHLLLRVCGYLKGTAKHTVMTVTSPDCFQAVYDHIMSTVKKSRVVHALALDVTGLEPLHHALAAVALAAQSLYSMTHTVRLTCRVSFTDASMKLLAPANRKCRTPATYALLSHLAEHPTGVELYPQPLACAANTRGGEELSAVQQELQDLLVRWAAAGVGVDVGLGAGAGGGAGGDVQGDGGSGPGGEWDMLSLRLFVSWSRGVTGVLE